nr:hypothetical protein [Xylella fastidiosa]
MPYDPNVPGGSNKSGTTKVFPSEVLTDKEIRQYAEVWARGAPFKRRGRKGFIELMRVMAPVCIEVRFVFK